ncbi:MAG TPA: SGNH/GDSL hydrolase family protein [Pyrinomonadaceae bacterium]|jgi:lysophospholipase L1-like esterase
MAHIVLLGDSIFDNKSYVGLGKDVVAHLREAIPADWQATLKAVDGNVTGNVSRQLSDLPETATHLIISVGGNDALMNADVLQMRAESAAQVLNELANRAERFEQDYSEMLRTVLSKNLPTALCTIYFPSFPDEQIQRIAVAALATFNDAIIRQAILNNLPLLDLRLICSQKADYANPIEPSDIGGRKIAQKIFELIEKHDFSKRRTQILA